MAEIEGSRPYRKNLVHERGPETGNIGLFVFDNLHREKENLNKTKHT